MSVSLTYVAGLDVGNGYTKGLITPQYVKGQSPSKEGRYLNPRYGRHSVSLGDGGTSQ